MLIPSKSCLSHDSDSIKKIIFPFQTCDTKSVSEPWECFLGILGDFAATEVEEGESFLLVIELILLRLRLNSLPFRMNLEVIGV